MFENLKKYKNSVAIECEKNKKFTFKKLVNESNKLKKKYPPIVYVYLFVQIVLSQF